MGKLDDAGRAIAGLLGYNPGPGIYSRLERAVEQMPANVRVQELPGLIKRYKEGVPGWEIREVLTPDLTEGVQSIPRQDLLDAVKERSPVYTHGEVVLGGRPQGVQMKSARRNQRYFTRSIPAVRYEYQEWSQPLGRSGNSVFGPPKYQDYGQGGKDYTEILLLQPDAPRSFGSHWRDHPNAVAHARFDTHGDALRINELQSDLGIHNRKAREQDASGAPRQLPNESDPEYVARLEEAGWPVQYDDEGEWILPGRKPAARFPLDDAWADILIKRMALEAARQGHRAIEIASPRAIADKVGGNIDNYEHFYGKVIPGAIERLGRKMGGLTPDAFNAPPPSSAVEGLKSEFLDIAREISAEVPARARDHFDRLVNDLQLGNSDWARQRAEQLAKAIDAAGISDPGAMPRIMSLAQRRANVLDAGMSAGDAVAQLPARSAPPGRRYIMSDAMRKAILTGGIGAAVAAPVMSDDDLIERLNQ